MVGLLDRFKKDEYGGTAEMASGGLGGEPAREPGPEVKTDNPVGYTSSMPEPPSSDIGIDSLMNKRVKLEEAIDYVGLMIKNLKDKRTRLEKEIEDESVDIKNLKEKLIKVREYIDEENQGIQDLAQKRSRVESEADEVSNIIADLEGRLSGIDGIINAEGDKIKSFKESRAGMN